MGKTLFNEKLGIEVESSECKIQIYTRQRSEQTISTQLLTFGVIEIPMGQNHDN
jgi:hypothetical protein